MTPSHCGGLPSPIPGSDTPARRGQGRRDHAGVGRLLWGIYKIREHRAPVRALKMPTLPGCLPAVAHQPTSRQFPACSACNYSRQRVNNRLPMWAYLFLSGMPDVWRFVIAMPDCQHCTVHRTNCRKSGRKHNFVHRNNLQSCSVPAHPDDVLSLIVKTPPNSQRNIVNSTRCLAPARTLK